jgi:putative ABC transport system permease protein
VSPDVPGWAGVAASVALVVLAAAITWRERLGVTRELLVAALRAFVQLVAVGAVLSFLFAEAGLLGALAWLAAMVAVASVEAARRARGLPGALRTAATGIGVGTATTLGILVVLQVVDTEPRVLVPVGGMVVSGAMQVAALVLRGLRTTATTRRPAVEARLSLGLSAGDAFAPYVHETVRTALIPAIDTTKVVGLISLPGAMTGLILAGVDPLTAIRYQIVVMYMLLAAAAVTGLVTARVASRALFDDAQRLRAVPVP